MNNVTRYEFEVYEGGGEVVVSETGCFVDYDDYLSQLQQTDALQTSLNNIINAFGIKGEGAHSKLVIEYVHGLVAENSELKGLIEMHAGGFAVCPNCSHEKPSETDDIVALYRSTETTNTDAFTAELRAQGVDELARTFNSETIEGSSMVMVAKTFAANLRAGRKG